ncbi:MAG: chalcone isomerase family protein [Pseudomonadota bacterium]
MKGRILGLILLACSGLVQANMTLARQVLEQPEVVGQARLSVLFFKVYDATLYAPKGQYRADQAFSLSLRYLRTFEGAKIAERSIDEMRKQGYANEQKLSAWRREMIALFPDVQAGSELTAVRTGSGVTDFYRGLDRLGQIKDPEFSRQFFAIWLSEKSSEPEMRRQLLRLSQQSR